MRKPFADGAGAVALVLCRTGVFLSSRRAAAVVGVVVAGAADEGVGVGVATAVGVPDTTVEARSRAGAEAGLFCGARAAGGTGVSVSLGVMVMAGTPPMRATAEVFHPHSSGADLHPARSRRVPPNHP